MEELLLFLTTASALCGISSPSTREYIFVYEPKTWHEARSYCRERYTDLVTIQNLQVVGILESQANLSRLAHPLGSHPAWIGFYDDATWRWSFASSDFYQEDEKLYRNWAEGAPDYSNGTDFCASINSNGVWDDVSCHTTFHPVCSDVNETAATFTYINTTMTWTEARTYCRVHHTDLASVRNLTENQQIHALNPAKSLWIGLYRRWRWSDNAWITFLNWKNGEPNGTTNCCAAALFGGSGLWEVRDCGERIGFICYWDVPDFQQVVRLKLVKPPSLDLNDPAALDDLLNKLQQKLKEHGQGMRLHKLSWRKQQDGTVFHKEKEK